MALGTQPCRASTSKASSSCQRGLLPRHLEAGRGRAAGSLPSQPSLSVPLPGRLPLSPGKQDSSRPDLLVSSWNHPRCRPRSHLPTCLGAGEGNSLGWPSWRPGPSVWASVSSLLPSPALASPPHPSPPPATGGVLRPRPCSRSLRAMTQQGRSPGAMQPGGRGRSSRRRSFTAEPPARPQEMRSFHLRTWEPLSQ